MEILVTICARGGSKGIPRKNIKEINDKPLIWYSINMAKLFANKHKADIALSTDSKEIQKVAAKYQLSTNYVRPNFLASNSAGKIDAIVDVWKFYEKKRNIKYDLIIDLDVTSPLRTLKDIEDAMDMLQKNENALNIFSVSTAKKNPYFNMVEKKSNGFFDVVKKEELILSRQKAPNVYDMNASFYIYKRAFFEKNNRSALTNASLVFPMDHLCFDLDEPIDFEFMEFLNQKNIIEL